MQREGGEIDRGNRRVRNAFMIIIIIIIIITKLTQPHPRSGCWDVIQFDVIIRHF